MIYEKKTLELLADQRLLSRFNKNTLKSNNNNIIKNMNNHYSIKANKFSNISKYINFILLLFIFINYK